MKLSNADFENPNLFGLCMRAIILLDGKKQEQCIEADEEGGFVVVYKTDSNGWVIGNEAGIETEKLFGKVQIIDPEAQDANHQTN